MLLAAERPVPTLPEDWKGRTLSRAAQCKLHSTRTAKKVNEKEGVGNEQQQQPKQFENSELTLKENDERKNGMHFF